MLPYFLLLFLSVVIPLFCYQPAKNTFCYSAIDIIRKRNKLTIVLFFVGFFALLSLRDIAVGIDIKTYKEFSKICHSTSWTKLSALSWEMGYTLYNKFLTTIYNNYRFFLIVTAAVILIPIYKLYSKEKRYCVLLILLFINMPCFLMIFSGLRQAIATSIGVWAYMALDDKKYALSVALVSLACCFHISAIVLLLIYPAYFLKIKTRYLLYVVPILIAIFVFRYPIFSLILNSVPSKYLMFYGKIEQTGAFGMLILFGLFLVFSFVILDETHMSDKDYFMRNMLLISTAFQIFVPVHGLIQRASYYFLIFVPVSIVSIVQAPKKKMKNVADVAIVVMGVFFFLYFFYNAAFSKDNLLNVFPYKFFWSGQ